MARDVKQFRKHYVFIYLFGLVLLNFFFIFGIDSLLIQIRSPYLSQVCAQFMIVLPKLIGTTAHA